MSVTQVSEADLQKREEQYEKAVMKSNKEEKKKRNRGCFGKKAEKVIPAEEEEKAEPFLLSGINVSFDAGQLTAVVGHVGCGGNRAVF